jgi:uncharacterized Zn-binding protein involved in type VI secretion
MVAYTDTTGFNKGSAQHRDNSSKMYLSEVTLNFVTITADRSTASLTALATGDSLQVLHVPAKTFVVAVGVDVTTADGTASTVDIGETGGDVDGWINGHNANTAGSACSTNNTLVEGTPNVFEPALGNGKYYSAADTIDLLMLTAPQDASVMRVWAIMIDCS